MSKQEKISFHVYDELFSVWANMLNRCRNPKVHNYRNYGGRGITVCNHWRVFKNFKVDMSPRPKGTQLDRIDSSKGYYKENCRWVSIKEQANPLRRVKRRDNSSGLTGVSLHKKHGYWKAQYFDGEKNVILYQGSNLLEACCARKSWEAKCLKDSFPIGFRPT